jgi:DNA replication and repair protein RecF
MTASTIHLLQYRNYSDTTFPLDRHTVFLGPNGSGKTNIVEAIRTLSVTKSYRINRDIDAIQWDQNYCRVTLTLAEENFEYILTRDELGVKKMIKHNGVAIPLTHVYGLIPTVLFSPETMDIIGGAPQERRRFLDTILSQADYDYIDQLMTYRKVMRERHFVLLRLQQGLGNADELDFWDSELVRTGMTIIQQREAFLLEMNALLATIYPTFIDEGSRESLAIQYKPSVSADNLAKRLQSNRFYDIKTGSTNSGPHRDEVVFLLDDRDITLFASRGEMRRSILAIKLAEARYLHDNKGKEPIILLDDVFSELDETRRSCFLQAIESFQWIITTTEAAFLNQDELAQLLVHELPTVSVPIT